MIPQVRLPGHSDGWTSADRAVVAVNIGDACRRQGYFFVHDHGVPPELICDAYSEARRFYRLTLEEKSKYDTAEDSQFLGYRALGRERSRVHRGTESCEQYRIGNTTDELAVPEADFYHAQFPQSLELFHHLTRLSDGLLAACALDLGLDENTFADHPGTPLHRLGLNRYAASHPSTSGPKNASAMSPHVDLSLLTILDQDEPGLDVRAADGTWLAVPAVPGALFVFIGDYLQRWSNGLHRAAPHRVNKVRNDRMSIQYKHRPAYGVVIAPLDDLTTTSNPTRYPPLDTGPGYMTVLKSILNK
ncbi:2OG-Fe(II) oxygenase family protein [Amycolatopsis magusensis]|uniref:2OG-Fe(II) oxygenase family protein n=1 Tax=Amycolatopsis magusensis TaxID=882444 RepID=UPI0027E10857|nr:2OG-Fe(II) oxygenase family protein [Amycolatopsis magusensis]